MRLKRLKKFSFFYAVFYVFLNIFCLTDNSYSQTSRKFVQPLILADYNRNTLFTNLGGLSGGDEEKPGLTFSTIVHDDLYAKGNSGYSLRLDYDVSNLGEFSFYWIKLGKDLPGKSGATEVLDLSNYNYLSFWVKGTSGQESIKLELHQDVDQNGIFVFGKDLSSHIYGGAYMPTGAIDKDWQKVVIPLDAFNKGRITDWSRIIELVFVFENRAGDKDSTIYIDDIMFGYRPDEVLSFKDTQDIKAPQESSFKVNGASAKQCLAFTGSNKLEIKAEDVGENPYLESVRFEYSTDGGNIWKTIGTDYDVSKPIYKVTWMPDNSRELLNYEVRAVASDIRGKEKATGVLISCGVKPLTDDEFLDLLERKAFDFFYDHQNLKTGLFYDTTGGGDASIASTGFGLAALCVGAERRWIPKKEAIKRANLALDAFLPKEEGSEPLAEGKYGFFYHFLNINTGKRAGKSEISTVDTAILVCGALASGEYFGGDIKRKAEDVYKNVEWGKFLSEEKGPWQNIFSMGWSPERGFLDSYWDYYTDEAILISLLAIGSPTYPVGSEVFYAWTRHEGSYSSGKPFVYSWHGSLFSYQYAHVWFDFRNMADKKGVNWFENSVNATLANRQFCIDNSDKFKGFGSNSWGITSMSRPEAYTMHFGVPPTGNGEPQYDGTISPTGPAGSIVFTPYLSVSALKYMYLTYPRLWGQYGFRDSFDLDLNWYASTYYGIGVSMMLLPIENFRSGLIWNNFMKSRYIKDALAKTGFTKTKSKRR